MDSHAASFGTQSPRSLNLDHVSLTRGYQSTLPASGLVSEAINLLIKQEFEQFQASNNAGIGGASGTLPTFKKYQPTFYKHTDNRVDPPLVNNLAKSMAAALTPQPKANIPMGYLPCRIVPYQRNTNFIGRGSVLQQINTILLPRRHHSSSKSASMQLCGMGGVGKTQTALSFVFEVWNYFDAILVASADQEDKLLNSYAEFAFRLGLTTSLTVDQKETIRLVMSWFEAASECLGPCDSIH